MADEHETTEERKIWDQQEGESSLWYGRFRAYLEMGFKRSVNAVFHGEEESKKIQENPRTNAGPEWYEASKKYDWKERAQAYDATWIEEQDKIIAQEREIVLRTGFAVQHRRIQSLDRILNKLIEWADEENKVWIPEIRTIIGENTTTHIDKKVFNAPMLSLIDKYKASIAAEMGERVKKNEIEHKGLPPNVYLDFNPDEDGSVIQEKDEGKDDNP